MLITGWLTHRRLLVFVTIALVGALTACSRPVQSPPIAGCHNTATATSARPNIVFVLADDLSSNLVQYMPHVLALARQGVDFTNYTVTDSLCCPSRSSIFSGRFPHDTHVFSNNPPDGGFAIFHRRGEER